MRIHPLTSLRFVAAMMVVAHHYWGFAPGYAGVGFFYILSGYVLAFSYGRKVGTADGRRDFWWRRFARIYPTHLLTLLLAVPLGSSLVTWPFNALLLQSWLPFGSFYMSLNRPSWSISNEAFFYAVFPLLLGIRWRTIALWAVALLTLALLWPEPPSFTVRGIGVEPTAWFFYIFPPVRLFEFALGIGLARLGGRMGTWQEAGALGLAAVSLAAAPLFPLAVGRAVFFIPASAALVYVFARSEGPIARALAHPALVLLGDASFMLYMIHWPLQQYLGSGVEVAALAVAASLALHLYFEKPVQNWLNSMPKRLDISRRALSTGERSRRAG